MAETRVKICGITRLADALAAQRAGADLIGFVFAKSPRRIEPDAAKRIIEKLACKTVGVFVDQPPDTINWIADLCGLDFAQLHGKETQKICDQIRVGVIKAIRVADKSALKTAAAYRVDRLLMDAWVPGLPGGTGVPLDWSLLDGFDRPYLLAGGLGPHNVAEAVARLSPWGVDASSCLESAPGIKDHEKIAAFVKAAKGADHAA